MKFFGQSVTVNYQLNTIQSDPKIIFFGKDCVLENFWEIERVNSRIQIRRIFRHDNQSSRT